MWIWNLEEEKKKKEINQINISYDENNGGTSSFTVYEARECIMRQYWYTAVRTVQ